MREDYSFLKKYGKILCIVPLPPPIHGQASASELIVSEMKKYFDVEIINYNKDKVFKHGLSSFKRIVEVLKVLRKVYKGQKKADLIYLTISQSIFGNLKDLITYVICFKKLSKMIIHLHGGGLKQIIFDKHSTMNLLNRIFLAKMGAVVVLGKSHIQIFNHMVSRDKIQVMPNCVDDIYILDEKTISRKFNDLRIVKILYLSNMLREKGYYEVLQAYKLMSKKYQDRVQIDFAGDFEDEKQKIAFLDDISKYKQITYHGVVVGDKKRELLGNAHIFALPTYYNYFEGQPISILEAYAAGCFVLTTDHGGIRDIFENDVNGYYVEKRSAESLKMKIEILLGDPSRLNRVALHNRKYVGEKHSKSDYIRSFLNLFRSILNNS